MTYPLLDFNQKTMTKSIICCLPGSVGTELIVKRFNFWVSDIPIMAGEAENI